MQDIGALREAKTSRCCLCSKKTPEPWTIS